MDSGYEQESTFTILKVASLAVPLLYPRLWRYWLGFVFLLGYNNSYNECNNELQIRNFQRGLTHMQMAFDEDDAPRNPCDLAVEDAVRTKSFRDKVFGIFARDLNKECTEFLRNKHHNPSSTCTPDIVLVKYFNNILFVQVGGSLIDNISSMIEKCAESFKWPYNWLVVALILPFSLYFCIYCLPSLLLNIWYHHGLIKLLNRGTVTPSAFSVPSAAPKLIAPAGYSSYAAWNNQIWRRGIRRRLKRMKENKE